MEEEKNTEDVWEEASEEKIDLLPKEEESVEEEGDFTASTSEDKKSEVEDGKESEKKIQTSSSSGCEIESEPEKREVMLENPSLEVKSFLDIEAMRVEELRLPISFGYTDEKLQKKNLLSVDGVNLSSLGQSLYNFKFQREAGIGKRTIHLKSRECKIGFEGTVYDNGSIGLTKLTSYSVCKDLPFKRAVEVYTFMQKLVAGNEVKVEGNKLDLSIVLPQRFEYLKLLKVVDTLYKYYSVSKEMNLNVNEKVEFILKNATKVNKLALLMRGLPVETMVSIEGKYVEELSQANALKITKKSSVKLKKTEIYFIQEINIPSFVLESQENSSEMSTSWKKATLSYKKVLD